MYNEKQAQDLVEKNYPNVKAKDCFMYGDIFLVRVEHPDPNEADYDPFFSVDPSTGLVNEFSVITDGDLTAITDAFLKRRPR